MRRLFDPALSMACALALSAAMLEVSRTAAAKAAELPAWCDASAREAAPREELPDLLVAPGNDAACAAVDGEAVRSPGPATCSLQAAAEYVGREGDPTPGDGVIHIGVLAAPPEGAAHALPYSGPVALENRTPERLIVEGCGAKLRGTTGREPVLLVRSGVGPLVVSSLEIEGASSAGLGVEGEGGDVTVEDLRIDGGEDGVRIENAGRVELRRLRVSNARRDGIRISASAPDRVTEILLGDTTLSDNYASGIRAASTGTGGLRLTVSNCRVEGNNVGLDVAAAGSSRFDLDVGGGSVFSAQRSHAVNLATPTTASGATATARLEGATIDGVGAGSGVRASVSGAARVSLVIEGSTIRDVGHGHGVDAIARLGSGRLDLVVTGNDIQPGPEAASAIQVTAGASEEDAVSVCAEITANTVHAGGGGEASVRLQQAGKSTLRLTGTMAELVHESTSGAAVATTGTITTAPASSCRPGAGGR